MLFLAALLPLLAATATSARSIHSERVVAPSQSTSTSTSTSSGHIEDRGLLDGLLGGLGQTVGNLGGTLGGVVGGLGNTLGGSLGGTVAGVGGALGGTVTTLGGTVVEVSKLNLDVLVNTCVRLGTSTHINEVGSVAGGLVGQGAGITLNAGACVCVDAATSASLAGVSANVGVYATGGLYFNGSAAADIASSTQPGLLGLQAGVYNFDAVETCISAQLSLSNSHHDLQGPGGSCCARACNTGYVLTGGTTCCLPGSTLDSQGNCLIIPTCDSQTEILCNNKCYPKSSYTCPSGLPIMIQSKRSPENCPIGLEKCSIGSSLTSSPLQFECVNTKSDIESCGGCMYSSSLNESKKQGTDCTSLAGTNGVSCLNGSCKIQTCIKGFKLSNNGTSCEEEVIEPQQQDLLYRRTHRIDQSKLKHQARLYKS
ncbi:uncharacterized protein L201_001138 [Kwoniella dendrophila CBS 6074]|uniref:Protein CPL1-like domain-containing protein n=1 Tax=Kwoniella dendrophila CBS 6074 TaxID=1295534 RepID=A0AAX4JNY9_9TREE